MARRVDHATVQLVPLEDIFRVEVFQAAVAPVECGYPGQVGHEAPEVLNPYEVLLAVELVDRPLKRLLSIERVTPLPFVIEEGVDLDPNHQPLFNGGDVGDLDGILDMIQVI